MGDALALFRRRPFSGSRWDFYALVLLGAAVITQVSAWPNFPLFMDCYYHLSVVRGFADAGGWVGEALWEFSPVGRAHLYPPLYHILELGLFRLGLAPIPIARLSDFLIYPCFLFLLWFFVRKTYSSRLAFLALLICLSSYSLYLALLNNTPFTLALVFGLLAAYFLNEAKAVSAALALGLAFYSHTLASWIMFFSIFLTGLFLPLLRRRFWTVCFSALLLASPLLWHQARYAAFVHFQRVVEFYYAQVNPVLYGLGGAGLFLALRRKDKFPFLIALTAGMSVLLLTHRNRFLSGHGLVVVSLMAAVFLDHLCERLFCLKNRVYHFVFWAGIVVLFYVAQPLLIFSPFRRAPVFSLDSGVVALRPSDADFREAKGKSLYHPRFIGDAERLVRQQSEEGETLFSNYPYVGGLIAVLAHRPTSFAMMSEVRPFFPLDPVRSARLVLWLKSEEGILPADITTLQQAYRLTMVGETELFYLYRNDAPVLSGRALRARVPEAVCFLILLSVLLVVLLENKNSKKVDISAML